MFEFDYSGLCLAKVWKPLDIDRIDVHLTEYTRFFIWDSGWVQIGGVGRRKQDPTFSELSNIKK